MLDNVRRLPPCRARTASHNLRMADAAHHDLERHRLLLEGQNRALQLATEGAPLEKVLDVLVRVAEAQSDGSFLASVLLVGEDGRHLRHGAAPSLPPAYNAAVDGLAIGPASGSCGTAAYFGHAIVATDIQRDPLWAQFRQLAQEHGLRACWSTPFLSPDGTVLGTMALYYRVPRGPTERDREIVKVLGATVALVLANARLQATLRDQAERAQLAARAGGLGFFTWDIAADTVTWQNDRPYEIFGISKSEPPVNARRFVQEFLHPDDQAAFSQAVRTALEGGVAFHFEGRIRQQATGETRWVEFTGKLDGQPGCKTPRVVGIAADITARRASGPAAH